MNSELMTLCRDMVAIPSVNPQERTEYAHPYGEGRLAAFVLDWLKKEGLEAHAQEVVPGRGNVVATAGGADPSRTLLLCAHMDTVDVQDMTIAPFDPVVHEGRLYGRGSSDTKGSLAAMMLAFRNRVRQGDLPANLTLLASCGEEYSMLGALAFAREYGAQITAGIFGESTEMQVATAHKGALRLCLRAEGRSAHSSRPDLGENAIYTFAQAALALRAHAEALPERRRHPRLGCETLAVTVAHGGQQVNVIPDRCEALADYRLLPGRARQDVVGEVQTLLDNATDGQVTVTELNCYDAMETDERHPFVGALRAAVSATTGHTQTTALPYGTDASAFVDLGIPTVILGPGDIRHAHSRDESIALTQLELAVTVYDAFLRGPWGI